MKIVSGLTVGRIVHVYSNKWKGPRAGIVSGVSPGLSCPRDDDGTRPTVVNVNIFADGTRDQEFLAFIRASPSGNTIGNLTVYEREAGAAEVTPDEIGAFGSHFHLPSGDSMQVLAVMPPRV